MAKEIERKFLVIDNNDYVDLAIDIRPIRQGFLANDKTKTVRVRSGKDKATLTIKGETIGITRTEHDIDIPVALADSILDEFCPIQMTKVRYVVPYKGHTWEVDVFTGDNIGLRISEIELKSAYEEFEKPSWLGKEVSHDPRYYNSELIKNPYKDWKDYN